MKRKTGFCLLAIVVIIFASSCQEFFTSSWAEGMARSSYKLPANLSLADAQDLLDQYGSDPEMAKALFPVFAKALTTLEPNTQAYNDAASAVVNTIITSTEAGSLIVDVFNSIPEDGEFDGEEDQLLSMIGAIDLNSSEVSALSLILDNPPSNMSSENAIFLVFILASDAISDTGLDNPSDFGDDEFAALEDNESWQMAVGFWELAEDLSGGAPTFLGMDLSGLGDFINGDD